MSLEARLGGRWHMHYMNSLRDDLFYYAYQYKNRSFMRASEIYQTEYKAQQKRHLKGEIPLWAVESFAIKQLEKYVRKNYHINRFKGKSK